MSNQIPRFNFGASSLKATATLRALTSPRHSAAQPIQADPGNLRVSMFADRTPVSGTWHSTLEVKQHLDVHPQCFAIVTLDSPNQEQLIAFGQDFQLHPVLLDEAIERHQRPKFDRDGDTTAAVFKAARYVDETESVLFEELHVISQPQCVVVIRLAPEPETRKVLAAPPLWFLDLTQQTDPYLTLGPMGILYGLLDALVDDYFPVVQGISDDVDEIEMQVFSGDPTAPERIYRLSREIVGFQRAVVPLRDLVGEIIESFEDSSNSKHLTQYIKDLHGHLIRISERITETRELLSQILTVNGTLVGQRQNEDMKRISSWAAILFAPTLIGAIYGMNFKNMPELNWYYGYPLALGAMVVFGIGLYVVFKSKKWL